MRNRTLKTMAALMGLLLLVGSTVIFVSGQDLENGTLLNSTKNISKRSIQGVWLVQVQQRNCQTGDPIGPAGHGLLTFAEGGTINETTAPPAPLVPLPIPFFRSPGHGIWERHNWEHYTAAIINQRLNADGTFAGCTRLRANFQLMESSNEFTSTGSFELINPSGTVIFTGCSTSTGTRFD